MTDSVPTDTPDDGNQEILAIVLDKPTRAEQLLLSLAHLQGEGKIRLYDAVIVAKDAEGRSRTFQTVDVTPAKGAVAGGWFGVLASLLIGGPVGLAVMAGGVAAGALYGKLVDRGLEDDWIKQMADWIDPDTSALLLLVERGFHPEVIEELRRFEGAGEIAYSTLPAGVRAEIEAALAGASRGGGRSTGEQTGDAHATGGEPTAAQTGETQTGETQTGETQTTAEQTGEPQTGETQTTAEQTGEPQTGETQTGEERTSEPRTGKEHATDV